MNKKRVESRIELSGAALTSLKDISKCNDMPQVEILSTLIDWFSKQPASIQAAILGHYPAEIQAEVARLLLKRMADRAE